ncbi:hypothetical protein AUR04nite_26640 [Glutamicibacter uratoxydans]|uniref:Phage shock protein PspC N-terminal domain-containing protein n=1 Tax=Glutamicibacter uratoxydans TaxID=43667 RepID=A0A4Y4DP85_GLUUR|nr:PspC domain-containing protein [Glutamicibacter uratoxydans]GED07132.1 hypothetical protein AUR04nite_26640 [Glutamicibacter uratoxydans]
MSNQRPASGGGFFSQMRKTQIVRQDSQWLGGVSAGIAQRYNIDVVLVRGVVVALSILGGLGLVLYALAWALLPDAKDQIHLEQALAKNWTSGMTGSVVMLAIGVFPAPWFLDTIAPVLWPVVIVAAVLFVVFSRRNTKFERPNKASSSSGPQGFSAAAPSAGASDEDLTVHGSIVEKNWRSDQQSFSARASAQSTEPKPAQQPTAPNDFQEYTMGSQYQAPSDPLQPGSEPTGSYDYTSHNPAQQAKAERKARLAPPVPGWAATTVVGLTVLVVAGVLGLDYLGIMDLPGSGWGIALAAGLLIVGLCIVLASAAKRTSGGLLGLAIPLLVLTLIFGNNIGSSTDAAPDSTDSGRSYSAVFSNSTIDLSDMSGIAENTTVDVSSVFSKVDLKLPPMVKVKVLNNGVFISDLDGELPQDRYSMSEQTPTLTVNVTGAFSSIDASVYTPNS